jgi:restriction endonuclease S subunit
VNPGPVPSLAEGRQSDIPIVIPSITVQKEILQVLRSQEASIGGVVLKVKEQIKTLQTLRSTLIAHAVTGRIKV